MKLHIELDRPTGCIDCPFANNGTYQDMGATIAYIWCGLNQIKDDGRRVAAKMKYHPFAYKDKENSNNHIWYSCTVWGEEEQKNKIEDGV